jgi:hypothetical protein
LSIRGNPRDRSNTNLAVNIIKAVSIIEPSPRAVLKRSKTVSLNLTPKASEAEHPTAPKASNEEPPHWPRMRRARLCLLGHRARPNAPRQWDRPRRWQRMVRPHIAISSENPRLLPITVASCWAGSLRSARDNRRRGAAVELGYWGRGGCLTTFSRKAVALGRAQTRVPGNQGAKLT